MSNRPGVRILPIVRYPYLVFYTVDDTAQEIQIIRIRHAAQDPTHDND